MSWINKEQFYIIEWEIKYYSQDQFFSELSTDFNTSIKCYQHGEHKIKSEYF